MEIVLAVVGFVLVAIGVTIIYGARNMAKSWFSFGDQNEGAKWLKIVGFICAVIGFLLVFFYL